MTAIAEITATDAITALLQRYETALNTSDAALAASCYTSDGIFMPTTLPTAEGAAMRDAYVTTFAAIRLRVTFAVDELVIASPDVAFGRTRSTGTQTIVASGATAAESNRELFIFRVEHGAWKIARYMFNKSH